MRRIRARTSRSILGRPQRRQDFRCQYALKPRRCYRSTVPGLTTMRASNTDGKSRYSHADEVLTKDSRLNDDYPVPPSSPGLRGFAGTFSESTVFDFQRAFTARTTRHAPFHFFLYKPQRSLPCSTAPDFAARRSETARTGQSRLPEASFDWDRVESLTTRSLRTYFRGA